MATQSQFVSTPVIDFASLGTANTDATSTSGMVTIAGGPTTAAGAGVGKRIARVTVAIPGSASVGTIRFYVSSDSGSTQSIIGELFVPATTGTSTSSMFMATVPQLIGLMLPGGSGPACLLRAKSTINTGVQVTVESGTF